MLSSKTAVVPLKVVQQLSATYNSCRQVDLSLTPRYLTETGPGHERLLVKSEALSPQR